MWIYRQSDGLLIGPDGLPIGKGYSGNGPDKNNPDSQAIKNRGPVPRGKYTLGAPRNSRLRGKYCLPLTPDDANVMFGRSAFLIHGDSIKNPGTASQGCIILPYAYRVTMWVSGDHELQVIQ